MRRFSYCLLVFAVLACAAQANAKDAYYSIPLDKLELTEGSWPKSEKDFDWRNWQLREYMRSYAVLDGSGEVYVTDTGAGFSPVPSPVAERNQANSRISVLAPAGNDITGRIFIPKADWTGFDVVKFKIPASAASEDAKTEFLKTKAQHYQQLLNRNISGGAWFRYQLREAQKAQGLKPNEDPNFQRPAMNRFGGFNDIDSTYDLFTGGRAISENIQLDRLLPVTKAGEETVAVDSLEGVTIAEIDWKPLIKDLNPKLDSLADKVPFDQHVIFFPSFKAALSMSDEAKKVPGLFSKMAESGSENTLTNARYEKQLCLTVSGLSRLFGPQIVKSVALTGSDPYFFSGTDLAVIFEAPQPDVLEKLILAQITIRAQAQKDAKPISGEYSGVSYKGFRSPDRSISTYIAKVNGVVVVTNSPYQLERLASVAKGETKAIASLDEYKFFRGRYALGDSDETAFFYLSDATIRRWCGPRWRIATSRRVRDAAVLANLQASQLDKLVEGKVATGPIYTDLPIAEKGELQLTPSGVVSTTLGSFDFMTPICELQLDRVSKAEAETYKRWRDMYQSNWRWAFDPIAMRLGVDKNKISSDLTVMPLIWGSEYREFINVSRGAKFAPDAGDPHNSLAQYMLAINKNSQHFHSGESFMRMMAPSIKADPLSWLGNYVSLYTEDDPIWEELAKVKPDDVQKFMEKNVSRLPVAFRADVSSGMKLTVFLVAFRAFVDQTAPGMTTWETLTYKEQSYVKITPTERARGPQNELENLAIYYSASGDSLLVTVNEALLKRSIDRQLAREESQKKGEKQPENAHPWLGENMAFMVEKKLVQLAAAMAEGTRHPSQMQAASWDNLPILNEWKRRYPKEDPVKLQAKFWQADLVCPGGGKYVWNEKWQTMESTVYGHPGEPKDGPSMLPIYQSFDRGDFGITFEEQGLRAKVMLTR